MVELLHGIRGVYTIEAAPEDKLALLLAVNHFCECVHDGDRITTQCPSHQMLTNERSVKGLFFDRKIAARLQAEEFDFVPLSIDLATIPA